MIFFSYLKKRYYEYKYKSIVSKDIKPYTLNGLKKYCKVVKVYDGDTITLVFKHHGELVKYSCRINGIDAPEMKSKNKKEKIKATEVRDYLRSLIDGQVIKVYFEKFDKYGRPLIRIRYHRKNLVDDLLEKGFVKEYHGGKKEEWIL